jgi:hypothetical protein
MLIFLLLLLFQFMGRCGRCLQILRRDPENVATSRPLERCEGAECHSNIIIRSPKTDLSHPCRASQSDARRRYCRAGKETSHLTRLSYEVESRNHHNIMILSSYVCTLTNSMIIFEQSGESEKFTTHHRPRHELPSFRVGNYGEMNLQGSDRSFSSVHFILRGSASLHRAVPTVVRVHLSSVAFVLHPAFVPFSLPTTMRHDERTSVLRVHFLSLLLLQSNSSFSL